jgi:outer membrane receptor for ferrienterochelin and colicins
MKVLVLVLVTTIFGPMALAQNSLVVTIKDSDSHQPLIGASVQVQGADNGAIADENGRVQLVNIHDGPQTFIIRFLGYSDNIVTLNFPREDTARFDILMERSHEELEEIIITTTRSSRSIENIPTRVEFIGGEELDEKITMQPGNIRMVLSESTGIQTQQTSASSANTTIRIQGLDGRYTQILKDGFPLYAGFSGGLSIMQIPPLDLKQVDVIKGSASTLYGGGAIAGLINLISKQPSDERERSVLVNGTSAIGLDASSFYSQRFRKTGLTLLASYNYNKEYDPAGIGFSAIPNFTRYTVNPRLFLYPNAKTNIVVGVNAAFENRFGGDMNVIQGNRDAIHTFYEQNKTSRISSQFSFDKGLSNSGKLTVKNSFNIFGRDIEQPDYLFGGTQLSSFSEAAYEHTDSRMDWVIGLNSWTDKFSEKRQPGIPPRDYRSMIAGAFIQNTLTAASWVSIESGLRVDYAAVSARQNGTLEDVFLLPRLSVLFRLSEKITSRIGGGLGYKTPTIFTEKAEEQVFNSVRPIDFSKVRSERSYGMNADINYQTAIGNDWTLGVNQLLFYTKLQSPLTFNQDSLVFDVYYFENANGHLDAIGSETNIKVGFRNFKLFWGYTFVDAINHFNGMRTSVPLTAKHRINAILMYEVEDKWRLGFESFYFGPQTLSTGFVTTDYWLVGFSAQRKWQHFSLFVNFENFTDTRQTRFGSVYTGTVTTPEFSEIYAPMDGFVFNAGFILYL